MSIHFVQVPFYPGTILSGYQFVRVPVCPQKVLEGRSSETYLWKKDPALKFPGQCHSTLFLSQCNMAIQDSLSESTAVEGELHKLSSQINKCAPKIKPFWGEVVPGENKHGNWVTWSCMSRCDCYKAKRLDCSRLFDQNPAGISLNERYLTEPGTRTKELCAG